MKQVRYRLFYPDKPIDYVLPPGQYPEGFKFYDISFEEALISMNYVKKIEPNLSVGVIEVNE